MVFRPYHFDGRMAYPALAMVDGSQAEQSIEAMFADPTIEMIHSRNVYAGCYMFAIHRPAPEQSRQSPCGPGRRTGTRKVNARA